MSSSLGQVVLENLVPLPSIPPVYHMNKHVAYFNIRSTKILKTVLFIYPSFKYNIDSGQCSRNKINRLLLGLI